MNEFRDRRRERTASERLLFPIGPDLAMRRAERWRAPLNLGVFAVLALFLGPFIAIGVTLLRVPDWQAVRDSYLMTMLGSVALAPVTIGLYLVALLCCVVILVLMVAERSLLGRNHVGTLIVIGLLVLPALVVPIAADELSLDTFLDAIVMLAPPALAATLLCWVATRGYQVATGRHGPMRRGWLHRG